MSLRSISQRIGGLCHWPCTVAVAVAAAMVPLAGHAAEDCVAPSEGPAICIAGVITAPGYQALLVTQPGKTGLRRLHLQDSIDDWTVSEIGPRYVVMTQADDSVRMELNDKSTSSLPIGQTASIKPGETREPTRQDMDQ